MSTITVTDRRAPAAAASATVGTAHLNAALAAFQAELPELVASQEATVTGKTQDGRPTSYKYNYANLGDFSPLVLRLLGKHGLAWTTRPTMTGAGQFVLEYRLLHSSGEEDGGVYPLPDPQRTDPQKLGGAITYARRYALCAMTGIAPGKDDDDAAGSRNRPAATPQLTPAERAREAIQREVTTQDLNPRLVLSAYFTKHGVDLRRDEDVTHLQAFAADLRDHPEETLAPPPEQAREEQDQAAEQPQDTPARPRVVRDAG